MSETNSGHHGNEGPDPGSLFTAITIYVLSDDLAFLPHLQ
jgi:hypothetical protein